METNWKFILQESNAYYYCVICGCHICGRQSTWGHVRGRRHESTMEIYADDISYSGNNQYYCQICNCHISGYLNVRGHLIGVRHQDSLDELDTKTSEDNSEHYVALSSRDFIISYSNCNMFYCCLCNCTIANKWEISSHLWCLGHVMAVKMYGSDILGNGSTWYYCRLCDCLISTYKNIYEHVKGQRHDNFLDQLESDTNTSEDDSDD